MKMKRGRVWPVCGTVDRVVASVLSSDRGRIRTLYLSIYFQANALQQLPNRVKRDHSVKYVTTFADNTSLLHKGKYPWISDLLFFWFGFNQTSKS